MIFRALFLSLGVLGGCRALLHEAGPRDVPSAVDSEPVYEPAAQNAFQPSRDESQDPPASIATVNALKELHDAVETMQNEYFSIWLGKWTTAIDWTAAVMGTHLSATLESLSHSLPYTMPGSFDKTRKVDVEAQMIENEINKYFGQSVTYYFGEDHFAIRMQAYDDMLWVVLGWLESIQFIEGHSARHYPSANSEWKGQPEWYGRQFVPAFAHRARVFYELAERGWDWRLCDGGMTWNPRLEPYKNAITNELFIAASIGMYMGFPGDDNCSPFLGASEMPPLGQQQHNNIAACTQGGNNPVSTYDPKYLANAIHGYDWLRNINMTNNLGLYVDGYHIKDYPKNHSKTECNVRNEMLYTYNQGVLLSASRSLWEATGNTTYLTDAHTLVRNVLRATGWFALFSSSSSDDSSSSSTPPKWHGLGSHGILTELCDPHATCSQDGQTFKGIFFHHLVAFCAPLPRAPVSPGNTHAASRKLRALHRRSCDEYAPWVVRNARAALRTRDERGRFGAWWGAAGLRGEGEEDVMAVLPEGAVDYRGGGMGEDGGMGRGNMGAGADAGAAGTDLNDRGRGRTVETQGGGVAVVRAMWEFLVWRLSGVWEEEKEEEEEEER